jgi:hypothetical protein
MSPICGADAARHADTAEAQENAKATQIPPMAKVGSRRRTDRFDNRINDLASMIHG